MTDEPTLFTCDWCGKQFPPDSNTMVESGFTVERVIDPADKWKGDTPITIDDIPEEVLEDMRKTMGMSENQIKELLEKGDIGNLASCVCIECQGDGEDEEEEEGEE